MNDLEITILCFALTLGIIGFFIGAIYNTKEINKLNNRIDKEVCGFNQRLKLLNNSVYGNFKNECKDSTEERLASLASDINKLSDAINKLARHTEYPKSKIV